MSKIRIITDSASDISTAEEQKYNILILPFPVTVGDKSYMSRVDFDNAGFYKIMEENPNELPKTAQITAFQFDELYKEQFDAGYTEIIFVSINKKGSATHDNAVMAKNEFFEEHPEYAGKGTIRILDTAVSMDIRLCRQQRWQKKEKQWMRSLLICQTFFRNDGSTSVFMD